MRIKYGVLIIGLIFLVSGCYENITGTVVDDETEKPIEGAVVLVEFDVTKGLPGLSYTDRYKVFETVTDKDGKFILSGVLNPFVNPPQLVIYKRGYVAWREYATFPDYKERKDFKWQNGSIFRLERFKRGYLHTRHTSFIGTGISSLGASSKLSQAIDWEERLAQKENDLYRKKRDSLKSSEKALIYPSSYPLKHNAMQRRKEIYNRIWQEVIQELYFPEKENRNE